MKSHYSDQSLQPNPFTILPAGIVDFPIDMVDTFYPQILVIAKWATTDTVTGMACVIHPGFLTNRTPGLVEYSNNGNIVTEFTTILPDPSSTNQEIKVAFAMSPSVYPRRVLLKFTNNDPTNAIVVRIYGDW
jgi:hypothetical protein